MPGRRLPWLIAGGAGAVAVMVAAAATPAADRMVTLPDGRRMHLVCRGTGTPAVILEGGWGADARSWTRVLDAVAARTTACATDRAGTGGSDRGPLPRSAAAIADDLAATLRAGKVPSPYILVAHSLGALPARVLAARADAQVAAMLLVEPSVEYQPQRMGGTAAAFAPMIARATAAGHTQQAAELEVLATLSSDEVVQARPPPRSMPLLVLTGGASQPPGLAQTRWWALHEALGGEHRVVEGAGHMLPRDRPEVVAAAALSLVDQVRAR